MELKNLTFKSIDGRPTVPEKITVELTLQEALWVVKVSGQQRGESPHSTIFSCLIGDVFNRYWDDGVDEALLNLPIETPPIRYED